MKTQNYRVCIRVSVEDNQFLSYYDAAYMADKNTAYDDRKHDNLGYKYYSGEDWYYQYDSEDKWYYVVVDK